MRPLSPAFVARGRSARMLLEILPEKRLRREIQMVGDLLDAHPRIFQQRLRFQNHRLVDPSRRRLPAHLLDHRRQVFRRDIHLLGIEAHVPLPFVVLLKQRHGD